MLPHELLEMARRTAPVQAEPRSAEAPSREKDCSPRHSLYTDVLAHHVQARRAVRQTAPPGGK